MEFFVPGLIFITTFQYLTSRNGSAFNILYSIVVSYVLKALFSTIHKLVLPNVEFGWYRRALILCVTAFLLSILATVLSELKITNKLFQSINHKSIHNDVWLDLIDYKNGTTVKIDTQNGTYTGILCAHEEKGLDSWFVISNYIYMENGEEHDCSNNVYNPKLAINLKDVKHIEIFTR